MYAIILNEWFKDLAGQIAVELFHEEFRVSERRGFVGRGYVQLVDLQFRAI